MWGVKKLHPKKKSTKNIILAIVGVLVLTATAMMVIYSPGTFGANPAGNIVAPATDTGGSWYEVTGFYKDIYGITILRTEFNASWTFSWNNGSLVNHYTPLWQATQVNWAFIAWFNLNPPNWVETAPNTWMAYGNGQYHVGFWYFSATQNFYSKVNVGPNSYGSATGSAGFGQVN